MSRTGRDENRNAPGVCRLVFTHHHHLLLGISVPRADTALWLWEQWRQARRLQTPGVGGDDGSAPEIRVGSRSMEKWCIDLVIAIGHLALVRIYNLMLDPPCSLSPSSHYHVFPAPQET